MKEHFASMEYGLIGLLFFFIFFMGVLVWLFLPGAKTKYKEYGNIPLEDDEDERS